MRESSQTSNGGRLEVVIVDFTSPEMPYLSGNVKIEVSSCCRKPLNYTADGIPYCPSCRRKYFEGRS